MIIMSAQSPSAFIQVRDKSRSIITIYREYVASMPKDELDTFQKAGGKRVLVVPYDYRVPKVRNILIILNLISFIYIFSYCPRCAS